jgi:outer membrane lipoprotein
MAVRGRDALPPVSGQVGSRSKMVQPAERKIYTLDMAPALSCSALLALCILAGCAHQLPDVIRHAPVQPLDVAQVRADPDRYLGQWVRWGGGLVNIDNQPQQTHLEILSRPLDSDGYPDPEGTPGPRFLARVQGFLDPALYAPQRLVTLVGRIDGTLRRAVGEFPYQYVVLDARAIHLWPKAQPRPCCPHRSWYDPWYDPWYYPWWRRPYFW